jgi:hypothetical protein
MTRESKRSARAKRSKTSAKMLRRERDQGETAAILEKYDSLNALLEQPTREEKEKSLPEEEDTEDLPEEEANVEETPDNIPEEEANVEETPDNIPEEEATVEETPDNIPEEEATVEETPDNIPEEEATVEETEQETMQSPTGAGINPSEESMTNGEESTFESLVQEEGVAEAIRTPHNKVFPERKVVDPIAPRQTTMKVETANSLLSNKYVLYGALAGVLLLLSFFIFRKPNGSAGSATIKDVPGGPVIVDVTEMNGKEQERSVKNSVNRVSSPRIVFGDLRKNPSLMVAPPMTPAQTS